MNSYGYIMDRDYRGLGYNYKIVMYTVIKPGANLMQFIVHSLMDGVMAIYGYSPVVKCYYSGRDYTKLNFEINIEAGDAMEQDFTMASLIRLYKYLANSIKESDYSSGDIIIVCPDSDHPDCDVDQLLKYDFIKLERDIK